MRAGYAGMEAGAMRGETTGSALPENEISDVPLALLFGLDGYQRVWTLNQLPPPPEILLPRTVRLELEPHEPAHTLPEHRRFLLQPSLRSRWHRWWHVYNGGRSRTSEDGFVYWEAR